MREHFKRWVAQVLAFFRRQKKTREKVASAASASPVNSVLPLATGEQAERSNAYHYEQNGLLSADEAKRRGELRLGAPGAQQEPGAVPEVSPPLSGATLSTPSGPNGPACPISGPLTRPVEGMRSESGASAENQTEKGIPPLPLLETPEEAAQRQQNEIRFGFARYLYQRGKLNEGFTHHIVEKSETKSVDK